MNTTIYNKILSYYEEQVSGYAQAIKDGTLGAFPVWPKEADKVVVDAFDPDVHKLLYAIRDLISGSLDFSVVGLETYWQEWTVDYGMFIFQFDFTDPVTGDVKRFSESDLLFPSVILDYVDEVHAGFGKGSNEHAKKWLIEASCAIDGETSNEVWRAYETILMVLHNDLDLQLAVVLNYSHNDDTEAEESLFLIKFFAKAVAKGALPWDIK